MTRFRHAATCALLLLWIPAMAPAAEPGFVPLFDGKTLHGWTIKSKPADKEKAAGFWSVDQGSILVDSTASQKHDYVLLVTDREYDNFVLRLRFQVGREVKGNSGIQIRSRYDEQDGYLDGPQLDIHPPAPWRTGMIWDETRGAHGWLYPKLEKGQGVSEALAAKGFKFFYADEGDGWNDFEITADGMKLEAVLNGVRVMQYDGTGVLDDEVHKNRNVGIKGVIALQIHRNDQLKMRFKDLRIKEL